MTSWTLYFDGLCEPTNPGGVMAWGWRVAAGDRLLARGHGHRPADRSNTNNIAEWYALGYGLRAVQELVAEHGRPERLVIRGDSKLVINQLTGAWQCRVAHLATLRDRCRVILKAIDPLPGWWDAEWVPREQNELADALSRQGYVDATGQQAPDRARAGAGGGRRG